ncbi:MAG: alpha/beta hydrolase, partial [Pseudomonadota bacterium]
RSTFHAPSYWFPDYIADLHQLLEHYQSGDAVRLVGHSMGANIGSLYAGTMPERVSAFINIEGFGLPDGDPADAPKRYRRWLEEGCVEQSYSEYSGFAELAAKVIKRSPGMSEEAAGFVVREWAYMDDNGIVRARADPNHKLPNAVLYRRAEAEACWQQITARMLLVSGGESRFAEQFGLTSQLPYPNAETVVISGAGHMMHFERPAELAREIERFFTQYL